VTRLETARVALVEVRDELDREWWPGHCKEYTDALQAALARMAQLEKVAELARPVASRDAGPFVWTDACQLLDLALTELDNHSETKED
jgi:hypothetical protein